MASSKVWIIEPRDSFIARDGRPFGVGVSATTLPFPFPSTTTGGVRTRAGLANGGFVGTAEQKEKLVKQVKEITVSGALLVELNEQGEIENWLMHSPADALLSQNNDDKGKVEIKKLVPLEANECKTNLEQAPHMEDDLAPVGLAKFDPNKPFDKAPRFWRWDYFKEWLMDSREIPAVIDPKTLGHNGAITETRTHVAIDPTTWTSPKGQLFQTRGLEFTHSNELKIGFAERLALAVNVKDHQLTQQMQEGLAPLGGERRIVGWRASKKQLPNDCLGSIQGKVVKDKACRVVLLTPACFTQGSRPTWLLSEQHNVKVELKAIANARAQVISGWDLDLRRPKPTRRLAPAGSVYFLKLVGEVASIKTWIEKIWMQPVSDENQDRRDGFGLAAVGVWDGKFQEMKF